MTADLAAIAWPDAKDLVHCYPIKGGPRHTRHLKLGWERPGPTGVLKYWGLPAGLINWAANLERAACLEAVSVELIEGRSPVPRETPEAQRIAVFISMVENRLGATRAHQRALEKAGDIGSAAHKRIEWELRSIMGLDAGVKPPLTEESTVAFMAWKTWFDASGITPLRVEQPVWSDTDEWAGTADLICLRDGKLGLIDLKTSKTIWETHHQQVAAYAHGINEMLGGYQLAAEFMREPAPHIEWAEIVKIPKEVGGSFEVVPLGKLYDRELSQDQLYACFLRNLENWRTIYGKVSP